MGSSQKLCLSSVGVGIAIGFVLTAIMAALLVVPLTWCCFKKRRQRKTGKAGQGGEGGGQGMGGKIIIPFLLCAA